ncbi:MAG: XRE family transcriptional regulator [Desulfurellales bacterium]|nr:MAG: XRE family transcriptional regulator [Desulfurellales bacterium]
MRIGDRIRAQRAKIEATQSDIARLTGFAPDHICHFESGRRQPTIDSLRRLCLALKCSADYLIGLKEK